VKFNYEFRGSHGVSEEPDDSVLSEERQQIPRTLVLIPITSYSDRLQCIDANAKTTMTFLPHLHRFVIHARYDFITVTI
jgi:hypothetical protein